MKRILTLALAMALFAQVVPYLVSQTSQGRILGTVSDASGAVVAGAKITIKNTATGVRRNLVTNDTGEYVAPNLDAGSYTVTAEAGGFKKAVSTPFVLEVARDVRMD